jgi:hypothetical protein
LAALKQLRMPQAARLLATNPLPGENQGHDDCEIGSGSRD